jgi:hypothetical protein
MVLDHLMPTQARCCTPGENEGRIKCDPGFHLHGTSVSQVRSAIAVYDVEIFKVLTLDISVWEEFTLRVLMTNISDYLPALAFLGGVFPVSFRRVDISLAFDLISCIATYFHTCISALTHANHLSEAWAKVDISQHLTPHDLHMYIRTYSLNKSSFSENATHMQ